MATNPQTLVAAAKCYAKCIPPGDWLPVLIELAAGFAGLGTDWILDTGFWDDNGIWIDTAVWID